jgi:hypothetical protein
MCVQSDTRTCNSYDFGIHIGNMTRESGISAKLLLIITAAERVVVNSKKMIRRNARLATVRLAK